MVSGTSRSTSTSRRGARGQRVVHYCSGYIIGMICGMQMLLLGFGSNHAVSLQQAGDASSLSVRNLNATSVRESEEGSHPQGIVKENNQDEIAKLRAALRKEIRAELEKEIMNENATSSVQAAPSSSVAAVVANTSTITDTTTTTNSPYAYAYIVGGCNPKSSDNYRGFLYNILVSARILRQQGSTADIVAMIQMAYASEAETLPEQETRWLDALGVKIRYLPKTKDESFRHTVLQKFRILDMVEYRRVIMMDADVMPIGNLDYMFQLSDGPEAIIKENLIISGPWEPANAGFFMLEPKQGDWEHIQRIMADQEADSIAHSNGYFDKVRGWGHVIDNTTDKWVARRCNGTLWDFHFAFSDQGLLYHWTKYVKKSVTIRHKEAVENWGAHPEKGTAVLEKTLENPFGEYSKPLMSVFIMRKKFIGDIVHFTGKGKPWMKGPPKNLEKFDKHKPTTDGLWFHMLRELNAELDMGLDFSNWTLSGKRPPHGLYAYNVKNTDTTKATQ